MEKTKDIPRWRQRLINEHAKPASEVTFKQYCHYHETRTKVLYPFLPPEQIKGKLFTQWKRQQPQNQNTSILGMKKIAKSRKFPVVVFHKDTTQQATLEKRLENQFDWLKENIAPKAAVMREKTYKNRAFTLVPKVPVIISETPNPERSILKNKSTGASTPRERRQPASQVSFTLNDPECHSPQLYSPPTPFVLSPMSDDDQKPDILPSKHNYPSSTFGHLPNITSTDNSPVKQSVKTVFEKPSRREMVTEQYPLKKTTANQVQKTVPSAENQKNVSNRKPQGRRARKEIQFTGVNSKDVILTECSHLSSQYLEPPKFGTVLHDSEDEKDKRFCLFEDEWIKPRTQPKKSKARKTKSKPLTEEREELFSWSQSPALGCSQYTPQVNKSKKGLFPTELEVYYKQKQTCTNFKQTEESPQGNKQKRQTRSGKKPLSETSANSASLKRPQNDKQKTKNVPGKRNAKQTLKTHKAQSEDACISDLLPEEEYTLREKENLGRINQPQAKIFKGKETRKHRSDVKEDQAMGSTISPKPRTTESASPSGHQTGGSHSKNRSRLTKGRDENHKETENASDKNSPIPQEKQYRKEIQTCDNTEKDVDCFAPSPNLVSPISSKAVSPVQQPAAQHSPRQAQGSDLLRRILFQLKSTASSGENGDQSSPAQSRMTEASGMSVRTLSSNGPSPSSPRDVGDLMDDLGPSGDLSYKNAPTTMKSGESRYRKRGNILCNMFDASDSDASVANKKRFLPSESRLSESDFNILFSADIFV